MKSGYWRLGFYPIGYPKRVQYLSDDNDPRFDSFLDAQEIADRLNSSNPESHWVINFVFMETETNMEVKPNG